MEPGDEDVLERGGKRPDARRCEPGARQLRSERVGRRVSAIHQDVGPFAEHLNARHAGNARENFRRAPVVGDDNLE